MNYRIALVIPLVLGACTTRVVFEEPTTVATSTTATTTTVPTPTTRAISEAERKANELARLTDGLPFPWGTATVSTRVTAAEELCDLVGQVGLEEVIYSSIALYEDGEMEGEGDVLGNFAAFLGHAIRIYCPQYEWQIDAFSSSVDEMQF